MRDPPVAKFDQMQGGNPGGRRIVDADGAEAGLGQLLGHHDDAAGGVAQPGQDGGQPPGHQHQSVDRAGAELAGQQSLALDGAFRAADQDAVAGFLRLLVDALDDLGEERVGDGGQQHQDLPAGLQPQPAPGLADRVAGPPDDFLDRQPGFFGDQRRSRQRAADRRGGDTGKIGDVLHLWLGHHLRFGHGHVGKLLRIVHPGRFDQLGAEIKLSVVQASRTQVPPSAADRTVAAMKRTPAAPSSTFGNITAPAASSPRMARAISA